MSNKKLKNIESDEPISAVEAHVDEMMDIKRSDPKPEPSTAPVFEASDVPVIALQPVVDDQTDTEKPLSAKTTVTPQLGKSISSLDDPETDALVDDILVHESDELLATRDARQSAENSRISDHAKKGSLLGRFFAGWWHNKITRYGTVFLLFAALAMLSLLPTSRYYALNLAGVQSAASLTILDNTTQLPLKNVTVELGQRKAKTNQDGVVKLSGLELGTQSLSITQPGFAPITKTVTLGWGSNPLGEFTLEAVGIQFRFKLVDYLTGKPVTDAEVSRGNANAQASDKGEVVLTTDKDDTEPLEAKITAAGYRSEEISLELGQKQSRNIVMVPSQKTIFVSKQSGAYDLYKMDIDGKNKKVLLPASGLEDSDITVVAHASGTDVAIVSRRDTTKNQDGFPLQSLTIVEVATGDVLKLDHSERIQIVDWMGDRLVYVKIKAGTSAGNPERYQLMSYDYKAAARIQLATANNFNDVLSMAGDIYYAASNNYQGGASQLVKINPDNTGKQVLLDKTDVWNMSRTSYDTLSLSVLQGSFNYKIGDTSAKKVSDSPVNTNETRYYLDAADGKHALWTDVRDGKGVLLSYDTTTTKDTALASQSGLNFPVRWLNSRTIVYRVVTAEDTADYAVSIDGGKPKKISDVTPTAGLGRWNYR